MCFQASSEWPHSLPRTLFVSSGVAVCTTTRIATLPAVFYSRDSIQFDELIHDGLNPSAGRPQITWTTPGIIQVANQLLPPYRYSLSDSFPRVLYSIPTYCGSLSTPHGCLLVAASQHEAIAAIGTKKFARHIAATHARKKKINGALLVYVCMHYVIPCRSRCLVSCLSCHVMSCHFSRLGFFLCRHDTRLGVLRGLHPTQTRPQRQDHPSKQLHLHRPLNDHSLYNSNTTRKNVVLLLVKVLGLCSRPTSRGPPECACACVLGCKFFASRPSPPVIILRTPPNSPRG